MATEATETLPGYINKLRHERGWPSVRDISRVVNYSHTHVGDVVSGRARPSSTALIAIIEYLHGDVDHARELWNVEKARERRLTTSRYDVILRRLIEMQELLERLVKEKES